MSCLETNKSLYKRKEHGDKDILDSSMNDCLPGLDGVVSDNERRGFKVDMTVSVNEPQTPVFSYSIPDLA